MSPVPPVSPLCPGPSPRSSTLHRLLISNPSQIHTCITIPDIAPHRPARYGSVGEPLKKEPWRLACSIASSKWYTNLGKKKKRNVLQTILPGHAAPTRTFPIQQTFLVVLNTKSRNSFFCGARSEARTQAPLALLSECRSLARALGFHGPTTLRLQNPCQSDKVVAEGQSLHQHRLTHSERTVNATFYT